MAESDWPMVRLVEEPREGVSAARNSGVREAQGAAILLLNDDTAPARDDLLAGHVAALRRYGSGSAILGRIRYPDEQLRDPFMRFLGEHAQFTYEDMRPGPILDPGRIYTAHLSMARHTFLEQGGFDERLSFGFEDAELAARMLAAGVEVRYEPQLATLHDHTMDVDSWARRAERMGRAGYLVNTLHPSRPPLACDPRGMYWTVLALLAPAVRESLPHRRLPARLRRAAYIVLNQGAYTRGYRRAARAAAK